MKRSGKIGFAQIVVQQKKRSIYYLYNKMIDVIHKDREKKKKGYRNYFMNNITLYHVFSIL